jgi:putative heme-binding domain-containing protein
MMPIVVRIASTPSACAFALGTALALALHGSAPSWAEDQSGADRHTTEAKATPAQRLFARDNLIAWCIVPFDAKKRTPEDRAVMLKRLGFKHFAYDWRPEHIPTFDAEVLALERHGVALDAFWVAPGEVNRESRIILDLLKRHAVHAQLWVLLDLGSDRVTGPEQDRRIAAACGKLRPLADEAAKIGCTLALYNHGGWFGEPENQIAIIERLRAQGARNVGIVYNLHHGHDHLARFSALLQKMKPYLLALNLNGMDTGGDRVGRKILPLGQGEHDLSLLRTIRDSGYRGPIGILGHTQDDAEARLLDNLDGLDWLLPQLEGKPPGPAPTLRTPVQQRPESKSSLPATETQAAATLVAQARKEGDSRRGALVFLNPRFSCSSCHKVGAAGGTVGPDLSTTGVCLSPEEIAESVLWPRRKIKEGYEAIAFSTDDGKVVQGYPIEKSEREIIVKEATGGTVRIATTSIEETHSIGTLMPEGIADTMTAAERRDLVRFLMDLGKKDNSSMALVGQHPQGPASFPFDRRPLQLDRWPNWQLPVNRERVYDFYAKEAEYFRKQSPVPLLLPPFPGLDGGSHGHWGNQNEESWVDGRWNETALGSVQCGVFRGSGITVPKGVCVRLGEQGEMSTCFNPESLAYEALWKSGFVRFSPVRHGFLDGLIQSGSALPRPAGRRPAKPFKYRGFYRYGKRVIFAYQIDGKDYLDEPRLESPSFSRKIMPADDPVYACLIRGGPAQWPEVLTTRGSLGKGRPYAIDTIEPPFQNPWKALLFFGDHDFLPDGSAMLCTMQGDVWHVTGLDRSLSQVRWRRFAAGLHQALGLVVANGLVHVLGRDQITRLHDLNGDGEADFYECVTNAYETSPAGHDFISGLQRDAAGNFYTVSGKQGLLRIDKEGQAIDVLATGFRNPDGLGLSSTGVLTVPNSEGEWVPASMVCEVRPGGSYGYLGPRDGRPPDLPLVYLPRGLDNSSAAQVEVTSDRWGPLRGQLIHLSYGAGTHYLLLREHVDGQTQGAAAPLQGDFQSGVHRGRFNPVDGQLYVSGMAGWGTYTSQDGCFQRVRYTGDPVQLPVAFHAVENGVLVTFSFPLDRAWAEQAGSHFAQAWNYRYSSGYGSPELSPRHPGIPGHDPLPIRSAHVLGDGRSLFLEIPEIQPVNQLHLHLRVDGGDPQDLYATVHKLAAPFTAFPGYRPISKTIAAHPILADMAALQVVKVPNPWRGSQRGAREIHLAAGTNLSYSLAAFSVRAGEPIRLTFSNPDVVPHNWALARPGTLAKVGDLVNKIIAEPDAASRHYIPRTPDILVYTDIVEPGGDFSIAFRAPTQKGRYPYLCTFPGHWMVMNGVMTVE